jgi:hypothetical protein
MRRDDVRKHQFPIKRKRILCARMRLNPDRLDAAGEMSFSTRTFKSLVGGATANPPRRSQTDLPDALTRQTSMISFDVAEPSCRLGDVHRSDSGEQQRHQAGHSKRYRRRVLRIEENSNSRIEALGRLLVLRPNPRRARLVRHLRGRSRQSHEESPPSESKMSHFI